MIQPVRSLATQPQARGCIYECLGADNPREAIEELLGDINTVTDPSILKVAEFALLKAPVVAGTEQYLEDPFQYDQGMETSDPHALYRNVGEKTALFVVKALAQDPNQDLAEEINQRRVKILSKLGASSAEAVSAATTRIEKAAQSGAITMYAAALVNAFEIADTTDLVEKDREQFIAAVKLSGELPRALTRIHLSKASTAHTVITQHGKAIQQGKKSRSINAGCVVADAKGISRLKVPLSEWEYPVGKAVGPDGRTLFVALGKLGEKKISDVPIGCLLSFEPQVTTQYYRHYVDLLEQYKAWPAALSLFD